MAAFSTLALIGLAAGAGIFAGKKLTEAQIEANAPDQPKAPAPTTPTANTPTPPDATLAASTATAAAGAAAARTRRRAAAGGAGLVSAPGQSMAATGGSAPRTLIGS